jgi:hypothetical protein
MQLLRSSFQRSVGANRSTRERWWGRWRVLSWLAARQKVGGKHEQLPRIHIP